MPNTYSCAVLSNNPLTPSCSELWVSAPELCEEARPGQFVHIRCENTFLRRPISICDVHSGALRLVVDARGKGTAWLTSRNPRDLLDILGPLGNPFAISGARILVAGGGIGVPPLLLAAKTAATRTGCEVHAVLGFRSASERILEQDFQAHCRSVTVTTDDGSAGQKGYADLAVRTLLSEQAFDQVLACGPKPMLHAVAMVCKELNVPLQVSLEEVMACGVGTCLGCACKTAGPGGVVRHSHVCKDGPVFDASEVIWDD